MSKIKIDYFKQFEEMNCLLDDDYMKLCDELNKYKKSYKKMEVLVREFEKFLSKYGRMIYGDEWERDVSYLQDRISRRLNYW